MQTFVPYTDIRECAESLDYRRLGKQRVEVLQILRASMKVPGKEGSSWKAGQVGWSNHPATKMWKGHLSGLIAYGVAICDEWISRGYKDTCRDKILQCGIPDEMDMPLWWGDEKVHSSHRANLLRKFPEHYAQFGWTEDPNMPYFWPSNDDYSERIAIAG
jgi:hypothetical protein